MQIAFLGDIALIGRYDLQKNPDVKDSVAYLKKILEKYDYVVANLESPLTEKENTIVCKSMHLKSPVINVEILKYLGIDAVTVANNHIMDYGRKGLDETISVLEKNGISWYGVDGKSFMLQNGNGKINFSGFCCYSTNASGYCNTRKKKGVNPLTQENVFKQIKNDKEKGAFSVLSVHWGIEHTNYPAYEHIRLAQRLAQEKDIIVHGHHPHIIQGVSMIDNSIIAYSQGNALFDTCVSVNGKFKVEMNEDNKKSFVLGVTIEDNKILDYKLEGFYIGNKIEEYDIIPELSSISEKLKNITDVSVYEKLRKEQFYEVIGEKFGRRDIHWLLNKCNYYSVGAKLLTIFRTQKYKREAEHFTGK